MEFGRPVKTIVKDGFWSKFHHPGLNLLLHPESFNTLKYFQNHLFLMCFNLT